MVEKKKKNVKYSEQPRYKCIEEYENILDKKYMGNINKSMRSLILEITKIIKEGG
jgi:hypothetical protein